MFLSQVGIPENKSMNNRQSEDLDGDENQEEKEDYDENRRVVKQDLQIFCNRLEKFISYIQSIRDLQFLTYDYPVIVQNRLDNDLIELESMLKEIGAALNNIAKQKAQGSLVKKEKIAIKKTLSRIKNDESREMEKIVALYDKSLYARWESVKMSHNTEALNSLLTDVKCKQLALENLDTMLTRKLANLKIITTKIPNKSVKIYKENAIVPLTFPALPPVPNERKSRIPLPPPLPPPPSLASRINAQSLATRRHRRIQIENNSIYNTTRNIDNLSVIPLPFNVNDNTLNNFIGNPWDDMAVLPYGPRNRVATLPSGLTANLHQEMESVLQALFGDSRTREATFLIDDSRTNESDDTREGSIELLPLPPSDS